MRGIDLDVARGQFVVLLGPSGCGKTTTLRMIAGLEIATGGSIMLDGIDVTTLRPGQRDVGFVFQFYALYPHLRVRDNIAFPLVSVGTPRDEVNQLVNDVADKLGITALLGKHPRHISGGDQQRVSLARAMVRQPKLWLMDEPLGTLDADVRAEMREFIRERQLQQQVTTIYVTHDQEEAMSLADVVVVMDSGQIRQAAPPATVYDSPSDRFVAQFVGSPGMNFMEGRVEGSMFVTKSDTTITLDRVYPTGPATLGARPEAVTIRANGPIAGTAALVEYLGSHALVHVDTADGRVCVRADAAVPAMAGDDVRLGFEVARLNLFDSEGRSMTAVARASRP
ncbi:MAG: ABC transporter ATP-binding protein [Tepidisphaeraceae bacterium]